jgi:hypothetical protein
MNIRDLSLKLAEAVDAWRVVPRLVLICYAWLVYELYLWYTKIPTYVQERCDAAVIQIFVDSGMSIEKAQQLACTVIDVVGGPTAAQSAFVTTIIGLSTGIFGLYASTGRRWDKNAPEAPQIIVNPPAPIQPQPEIEDRRKRWDRDRNDEVNPLPQKPKPLPSAPEDEGPRP